MVTHTHTHTHKQSTVPSAHAGEGNELEKAHSDLIVSLPLNAFLNSPTCELSIICKQLSKCDCIPSGWTMSPEEVDILTFYRISGTDPEVSHIVKVLEALEPKISIFGKTLTVANTRISILSICYNLLKKCPCAQEIRSLLTCVILEEMNYIIVQVNHR